MTAIALVLIFALLAFYFLYSIGASINIYFNFEEFLDSYEFLDKEGNGKINEDYFQWKGNRVVIPVKGKINFSKNFPKWYLMFSPLEIDFSLSGNSKPKGFDIFMKRDFSIEEYSPKHKMTIKVDRGKSDSFEFSIVIAKTDITIELNEPNLFSLNLKGVIRPMKLFHFKKVSANYFSKEYSFYAGPDLGNTWIALDPGTTGSCIAMGSATEVEIIMEKESDGSSKITPSAIVFNKESSPENIEIESGINPKLYKVGDEAIAEIKLSKNISFQSIKKLLGFEDTKQIIFENKKSLKVTGKDLSSILIKELFKNFKNFVEGDKIAFKNYLKNGEFMPMRAVVALPNNFTYTKITSLIECVKSVSQFKEIRYITEAQAMLCFYIFEKNKLNPAPKKDKLDETVLIFDMGGATINTTVADVVQTEENNLNGIYEIDIDSHIGYGVGGDTIDYCLTKTIFSYEEEYPVLKKFNPFQNDRYSDEGIKHLRKNIQQVIFKMKKQIIQRFSDKLYLDDGSTERSRKDYKNISDSFNVSKDGGSIIYARGII